MNTITKNNSRNYHTTAIYTKTVELWASGKNSAITAEGWLPILVFFMDLYALHSDPKVLEQIHTLMEYYYKTVQKNEGDYSVITGKSGFLYAATMLSEIDKSSDFLARAMAFLGAGFSNFIQSPYTNNSIFKGRSGCLLVLNYYHSISQDDAAQKWMDVLVQKLISEAQLSDKGVYWNDPFEKVNGLLDFNNGNAGIGYLFLVLGDRYEREDFQTLAQQIYNHQSQFWDGPLTWKKSKKGIHDLASYKKAIQAIKEANQAFFEPALNDLSLQIGLSKFALHLWQKTSKESLKAALIGQLSTCRTFLSNAKISPQEAIELGTLFISAARILLDQEYLKDAKTVADSLQAQNSHEAGDDFASCVLAAQIAHLNLALENPSIDNALLSKGEVPTKDNALKFSPLHLKESLLQNTFSRTLSFLKSIDGPLIEDYLKHPIQEKEVFNFMLFLKKNSKQFPGIPKKQLSEILKLEISRYNLKKGIQNYAHLEAKNIYNYQSVQALFNVTDEELGTIKLQLNPKAKKITTAWDWEIKQGSISEKKLLDPESKFQVFLLPHYKNLVVEYWQNPHNVILNHFENQTSIAEAIVQIQEFYLAKDEIYMDKFSQFIMAEKEYVLANLATIILNRIKEYLGMGLLEIVE